MSSVIEHVKLVQAENFGQGTFKLAPLQKTPLRLGFPDSSQPLEAIEGTPYGSLAREKKLPPPRIRCQDKPTKKAFLKMATGSLQGEYTYETSITEEGPSRLLLQVGGTDESAPDHCKGYLIDVQLDAGPNSPAFGGECRPLRFAYATQHYNNGQFGNRLTPEEKADLAHRIAHNFVRAFGSDLPFQLVKDIDNAMSDYYPQRKYFLEGKDAKIIFADIAIHSKHSPMDIGKALVKIGEYTESEGDEKKAGHLYMQAIDSYGSEFYPLDLAIYHHYAGLALRNGKVMDKAEEYLIRGWNVYCKYMQENGKAIDSNDDAPTNLFTTLLILYDMLAEKAARSGLQSPVQEIHPIFCGLMYQAGFQARLGGRSHSMVFSTGSETAAMLLPGFTRQAAQQVLVQGARYDLVQSSDTPVEHFRAAILSAKDPHSIVASVSDFTEEDPYYQSNPKRDAKFIKRAIRKGASTGFNLERCIGCGRLERSDGKANLRCPCQTAHYCGKECQVAHWKEHKKICSVHLAKKAAKKSG